MTRTTIENIYTGWSNHTVTKYSDLIQAKTIHADWIKRRIMKTSLLYAAHVDARDNVQLEVEYNAF